LICLGVILNITNRFPVTFAIFAENCTMTKYVLITLSGLFLISCDQTTRHKPAIDALAAEWTTATQQIAEAATTMENNRNTIDLVRPNIELRSKLLAKKTESEQKYLKEMWLAFDTQLNGLDKLLLQVNEFKTGWATKTERVQKLQQGLQNKKLDENTESEIQALNDAILEVVPLVESWNNKSKGALTTAMTAYQNMYHILYPKK